MSDRLQPPQQQPEPGRQRQMIPQPDTKPRHTSGSRLQDNVAIITGGDSGIGRAVALAFAAEGADVAIIYLKEDDDAHDTAKMVEKYGRRCLSIAGNISDPAFCKTAVKHTIKTLGRLDILVNNAAEQHPTDEGQGIEAISSEQLDRTFRTNIYGYFFMVQAALPYLKDGASIINTTSVTAYQGHPQLIDYSSTKGAIRAFTYSLALSLASKKIRVNGVAPGPIWTPLIVSTFPADKVASFGSNVPLGRAGQPNEVAPSYVFLASDDASYITGQIIHPNGGKIVNG